MLAPRRFGKSSRLRMLPVKRPDDRRQVVRRVRRVAEFQGIIERDNLAVYGPQLPAFCQST